MEEVTRISYEEPSLALELSRKSKTLALGHTMASAFERIGQEIAKQDIKSQGHVYTRYKNLNWMQEANKGFFARFISLFTKVWEIDMGIEVTKLDKIADGFSQGGIEPAQYLSYKHIGPYSKLGKSYAKITDYILKNNIEVDHVAYDIYLNDPLTVPKSQLETLILVKIKSS